MRPVFHPQVYADLAKIMEYYERVATPELADDFYGAGRWSSLKNAVILSGVSGGFATGTERRIADSPAGGGGLVKCVRLPTHRLRPFLSAILHCVSPPPAPTAKLCSE